MADVVAVASASRDGYWRAELPAMAAGGPFELEVKSRGSTQLIHDVMVGDVWLCSGQSNMALPLSRTLNSGVEIATSSDLDLRLLTISRSDSLVPLPLRGAGSLGQGCAGHDRRFLVSMCTFRQGASPIARGADRLGRQCLGGTSIRAWMSCRALDAQGDYRDGLTLLDLSALRPERTYAQWGHQ